ncbi:MAG: dynamin family protein [Anaerotignum sp.]|nr:dynamin family protein [Anaerotignum sp.]
MKNYENVKELSNKVMEGMTVYADLLGTPDQNKKDIYGFVPGLGMTAESMMLHQQQEKLQEGVFQVLFTGVFNGGKSTLMNALMGRDILRMAATPETAIITKVVFGKEEKVIVYMKESDAHTGEKLKQELTLEEFFEEYRVDQEDTEKFEKVDHAVLQVAQEGIGGNMVQLVDSPGTLNCAADTKAAREFAKSADAIVYLIHAGLPFTEDDKAYVKEHFAGKHMQNLFFVVNHFDQVDEAGVPALKEHIRTQLTDVFTKENGSFDEELFQNRVFYTNAYGALKARKGEPIRVMGAEIMVDENTTGVPVFENALAHFLTDGGRDRKAFQAYLPKMAGMYQAAEAQIEAIMQVYEGTAEELEKKKAWLEENMAVYNNILESIRESCCECATGILQDARNEYQQCVSRINKGWNAHFAEADIQFGIGQMAGMAWDKIWGALSEDEEAKQKKLEKRMKPLTDAVNAYISPEMKRIAAGVEEAIDNRLQTLQRKLNTYSKQLQSMDSPISYEEIAKALKKAYNMDTEGMATGVEDHSDLVQIIMGIMACDPETIMKGVGGNETTGRAVFNTLKNTLFEAVAMTIYWPVGVTMLAYRLMNMIKQGKAARRTGAQTMLEAMREATVAELNHREESFILDMDAELSVITRSGRMMTDNIQSQIDDYIQRLEKAIREMEENSEAAKEEAERTEKIRALLLKQLETMYSMLNSSVLTEQRLREIAVHAA